jgi:hypothetical protein
MGLDGWVVGRGSQDGKAVANRVIIIDNRLEGNSSLRKVKTKVSGVLVFENLVGIGRRAKRVSSVNDFIVGNLQHIVTAAYLPGIVRVGMIIIIPGRRLRPDFIVGCGTCTVVILIGGCRVVGTFGTLRRCQALHSLDHQLTGMNAPLVGLPQAKNTAPAGRIMMRG